MAKNKKKQTAASIAQREFGWLQAATQDTAISIGEDPDALWNDSDFLLDMLGDRMYGIVPPEFRLAVMQKLEELMTHPAGKKAVQKLIADETQPPPI